MNDVSGPIFRQYIWGENGICDQLKSLKHKDYGKDLVIILFKFYVNPVPYLRRNLKEIENYRKEEKAIGVPIIVNNENFFDRSEEEWRDFLRRTILQKLDLLEQVVKRKKLDTNLERLKVDTEKVLMAI